MFKTIMLTLLKPALYAALPMICDFGLRLVTHMMTFQPNGMVEVTIWDAVFVSLGAGLTKLLIRWKTWNPAKVGK